MDCNTQKLTLVVQFHVPYAEYLKAVFHFRLFGRTHAQKSRVCFPPYAEFGNIIFRVVAYSTALRLVFLTPVLQNNAGQVCLSCMHILGRMEVRYHLWYTWRRSMRRLKSRKQSMRHHDPKVACKELQDILTLNLRGSWYTNLT